MLLAKIVQRNYENFYYHYYYLVNIVYSLFSGVYVKVFRFWEEKESQQKRNILKVFT